MDHYLAASPSLRFTAANSLKSSRDSRVCVCARIEPASVIFFHRTLCDCILEIHFHLLEVH